MLKIKKISLFAALFNLRWHRTDWSYLPILLLPKLMLSGLPIMNGLRISHRT